MPAAAETPHAPDTGSGPGSVIRMSDHADRRPRRTEPPAPGPESTEPPTTLDHIAYRVQALFTTRDRTLTDESTAEAFTITLDGVLGLLDGALAEGVLEEAQHQQLHALLEAMREAPGRL